MTGPILLFWSINLQMGHDRCRVYIYTTPMNEDGKEKNSGQNKIPLFSDPSRIELKKRSVQQSFLYQWTLVDISCLHTHIIYKCPLTLLYLTADILILGIQGATATHWL